MPLDYVKQTQITLVAIKNLVYQNEKSFLELLLKDYKISDVSGWRIYHFHIGTTVRTSIEHKEGRRYDIFIDFEEFNEWYSKLV